MAITAIVILVTMIMTIELVNRANQLPKDASTVDQDLIDKIQNSNNELETIIQSLAIQIEKAQEGINIPTPVIIDDVKEFQRQIQALQKKIADLREQLNHAQLVNGSPLPNLEAIRELRDGIQEKLDQLRAEDAVIYKPSKTSNRNAWIIIASEKEFKIRPISTLSRDVTFNQPDRDSRRTALEKHLNRYDPASDYFLIVLHPSATASYFDLLQAFVDSGIPAGADLIDEEMKVLTRADVGLLK